MRVFVSFPGWYESSLSYDVDFEIENRAEWLETEDGILDADWTDFRIDHEAIERAYLDAYESELNSEYGTNVHLTYVTCHHPRGYNFYSDSLEAEIPDAEFMALIDAVKAAGLWEPFRAEVKERLKPRSGFVPFYSNDLEKWGDPLSWECPQTEVFSISF